MKIPHLNKPIFLSNIPYLLKCLTGVIICYVLYKEIPQYPFYWAIVSVVIALAPDNSNRQAYDRMKANILGCIVGLCLYPVHVPNLLLLCIGITLTIGVGISLRLTSTLRSAMAALVIVLIHEEQVKQWYLPLERVLCVVAGCLVALIVTLVFNKIPRLFRSK
ncbi:MAG TPA: FUSC family protein [Puia sp.]